MAAVETYLVALAEGLVVVAEDAAQEPVGFAHCEAFPDALHLWALAVRHDHQGRGHGRALIEAVIALARNRPLPAVTLTTFRDLAWNGPLYARFGFEVLDDGLLGPRLTAVVAREAALGLDVEARCAMRLELGRSLGL